MELISSSLVSLGCHTTGRVVGSRGWAVHTCGIGLCSDPFQIFASYRLITACEMWVRRAEEFNHIQEQSQGLAPAQPRLGRLRDMPFLNNIRTESCANLHLCTKRSQRDLQPCETNKKHAQSSNFAGLRRLGCGSRGGLADAGWPSAFGLHSSTQGYGVHTPTLFAWTFAHSHLRCLRRQLRCRV